jgi:hypothetical protein
MTRHLPPATIERLAKICGLLASSQAGEVLNAAQAATKLLQRHGFTWGELVEAGTGGLTPNLPPSPSVGWRGAAAAIAARPDLLSTWELRFLANLVRFSKPSFKQAAILDRLYARVSAAGGAR